MGDEYHGFVSARLIHFLGHPPDVLWHYMTIGHAHQWTRVEAEEQNSFVFEFKTFSAENLSEGGAT